MPFRDAEAELTRTGVRRRVDWRHTWAAVREVRADLLLIGSILALLWLAIGAWVVNERRELATEAARIAANIAGAAEQGVSRTIEAMDQRLRFVREAYRRDPAQFDLSFLSSEAGYRDGMMMQLAYIDRTGLLRDTNLGRPAGPVDLSDRPHFRVHLDRADDTLFISVPVLGRVSNKWSVQFTRKVFGPDGTLAGVIVGSLDPYWLTQFHELLDVSGSLLLVGTDGIVRASAPDLSAIGRDERGSALGQAVAGSDHGTMVLAAGSGSARQVAAFRRLRDYPVAVAVLLDTAPLFAANRTATGAALAIGAGLTVLVLGAGVLMIRGRLGVLNSRQVLRGAIENIDQGLVMVDGQGQVMVHNRRFVTLLGLPPAMVRPGARLADLIGWQAGSDDPHPPRERQADPALRDPAPDDSQPQNPRNGVYERTRADGTVLEVRTQPLPDGGMVRTYTDITDRRQAEERIFHLAHHDGLTGLANRTLLEERLARALNLARRSGQMLAVLCLDLDRFKPVNDSLGHAAGDDLLRQTAQRLTGLVRTHDIVTRLGGDEFAVVQTGIAHPSDAVALAERIIAALSEPFMLDVHQVKVGASVGIALFPADGESMDTLLKNADAALYRAKQASRGSVRFFENGMEQMMRERAALEHDLRDALALGQFSLHFQPLYACGTRTVIAYEALLRWMHPERGMVSPADFIPVAEECGLILPLGRWVLEQACFAAASWPEPISVAVNLSPVQMHRGNLPAVVAEVLQITGLAANRLELEITEGVLIEDVEGALSTLTALKALGVRLALDDFGTGYSSLSYLRRFPFDKLKIDKSFTQALEQDQGARVIVEAILAMGHSLALRVTAEGVETEPQLAFLQARMCDEVQGFLLGRPMPIAAIPAPAPPVPAVA